MFNEFYNVEGIVRHHTVRDIPQQNGVAECMKQRLLERVRCMVSNIGLARRFWVEAVNTTCYMINHELHIGIDCKAP